MRSGLCDLSRSLGSASGGSIAYIPFAEEDEPESVVRKLHFKLESPLTDIKEPAPETDQAEWLDKLAWLQEERGEITVMHLSDIHALFQDVAALEVAYQLVEYTQPDVILVGSDSADFVLLVSEQDGWFHATIIVNADRPLSDTRWLGRSRTHSAGQ
jgi:hypothetical protein